MRPARCCAPIWRPLPPIATSPGTARSAIASCASPWSPGATGSGERPGALPRPRRVPPDAKAPPDGPTRTKPGPKDPPRHDHRPDDSASGQWQARSWQASSGVTVVTERVFRPGYFTPPLQLVNLICAIARGWRAREDRSVRGCPTASGTLTHTPAQTRSQTHERPCRPPEANRPPGSGSTRPRGPTAGREAAQGTKKIALDPAESSAIDTTTPAEHRYDARWGRRPSSGAMGGRLGLGDLSAARMVMLCCCIAARQGCVRPRCAAAEYPQAVRGPQPRGTGDVHRACGWT